MGGYVRVVMYAGGQEEADAAAAAAFAAVAAVDAAMSDYREDSELSRLGASAGQGDRAVSGPMAGVLVASFRFAELSGGAFDPTVGPVVALWRRSRKSGWLPEERELRDALGRVGYRKMSLDTARQTVRLEPGMRLDFGGIAKGYAADRGLAALAARGVTRALVDAGGDLALGEPPPGRDGWRVRVADTDADLIVAWCGVATSGDTERFAEVEGCRYSHIVDPRTGIGLERINLATVVAPDGMSADALSTAVSVMGPERGIALAESIPGVEAWMRWREEDRLETAETTGWAGLIRQR